MSVQRPQRFIFKEPTKQLRRGQACLNCRFHKIKCDGVKPACGPCTRLPKDDPCEYTNTSGPSRKTKDLQQRITRLRARVRELEKSPELTSEVQLTDPYQPTHSGPSVMDIPPPSSDSSGASSSGSEDDDPYLESPEPGSAIITMLLDAFLPPSCRFGFFLDVDHFRTSALLPLPFGHSSRPSPALLSCAYLWGVHLSQGNALLAYETIFLRRALRQVSWEIANIAQSAQIMHTIQAEVLLAAYFFRNCQFLEAEFHINGAVSLSLSCGLHKIRSNRTLSTPIISVISDSELSLPPAQDPIEEHERVTGFWMTFCAQRLLSISSGTASRCFGSLDMPCSEIDTPWPQEGDERSWYSDFGNSTLGKFFSDPGRPDCLSSCGTRSWFIKACALLHHSVCLSKKLSCGLNSVEFEEFTNQCIALDDFLTRFHATLPAVSNSPAHSHTNTPQAPPQLLPTQQGMLIVIHVLVLCAYLKVQTIFSACGIDGASERSINTAQNIVRTLSGLHSLGTQHLSPIIGTLCGMAVHALGSELERAQAFATNSGSWVQDTLGMAEIVGLNPAVDPARTAALRSALDSSMTAMSVLAIGCPLARYQLSKLQQRYRLN